VCTAAHQGAGSAQAAKAARLALAEAAGFALDANPHSLSWLTSDTRGTEDGSASIHTLGIADTEDTAKALASWIKQAGLEPSALIPDEVPGIAAAVDAALNLADGDNITVVLHIGEHRSALAAASKGRLRFIRQIAIGTESLVQAWTRELNIDGRTVVLDHTGAAEMLVRVGIPERRQVVDPERGITGDALLPLVQPILQRCVVDIKQSLRFGLEEKERENVTVFGIGPGSNVPALMRLVADQSAMNLGASPAKPGRASAGMIDTWLEGRQISVNLLPRGLQSQLIDRRVRRGLWVGVAATLTLIVADAAMTRFELGSQERAAADLRHRMESTAPASALMQKLTSEQSALSSARQRVSAKLDSLADWDAVMVMLARCTPESVKLVQVNFLFDNGRPVCRLSGHAPIGGLADASATLQRFMDAMSATGIVRGCRLGAAQRSEIGGTAVQNFEMTVSLVQLPAPAQSPDAMTSAEQAAQEMSP
jgi:Tfp pilus assembly protein PilN